METYPNGQEVDDYYNDDTEQTQNIDTGDPNNMASNTLPDGWTVVTGAWGTDLDRIEATNAAPNNTFGGISALKFFDTGVATSVQSPPMVVTGELGSIGEDEYYNVAVWLKSSSTSGTITIKSIGFDAEGGSAGSNTLFSGAPPRANHWYLVSGTVDAYSVGRYIRIQIEKNTSADELTIDSVEVVKTPSHWMRYVAAPSIFTADSSWRTIGYTNIAGASNLAYQEIEQASGVHTILYAGIYTLAAKFQLDSLAASKLLKIRLKFVDTSAGSTFYFYGTWGDTTTPTAMVTAQIFMDYGDTIEVQGWCDNGGTPSYGGDSDDLQNYFTGVRIGR
jgi:hypothetical protein